MFSSTKSYSPKMNIDNRTLAVVVAVLFVILTLPVTWKLVGNLLSMVGLPTEVKEVNDSEGNTLQQVPMVLVLIHALVLSLLTVMVLNWWSKK